jgi:predicted enzyme related to lactoylglutathione lyase
MATRSQFIRGVGGVFFKVTNPERMAQWYQEHLGIESSDGSAEFHWREDDQASKRPPGRTVWALFPKDTSYLGASDRGFMINYCVHDLHALLEHLRSKGVTIEGTEDFEYGRFAWITDPEGNRIELWEPAATLD